MDQDTGESKLEMQPGDKITWSVWGRGPFISIALATGPHLQEYWCRAASDSPSHQDLNQSIWSNPYGLQEPRERTSMMSEVVIYTTQVAHVTFSITEQSGTASWIAEQSEAAGWKSFKVYSETKREGKRLIGETLDQDHAKLILNNEIKNLEERLEHRRKGSPTAQQLMFLFQQEIPIPLTLTWGEASDIISERLSQIAIDKETKKQAREELRRKEEELKQKAFDSPYHLGEKVLHPLFGLGTVLHAGRAMAGVQFQDEKKIVNVTDLTPEEHA